MALAIATSVLEYVWIDGHGSLRSKTRCIKLEGNITLEMIPSWNYDGSSTNQSTTNSSEIIIVPRCLFKDPFRTNGYLVLCSTYKSCVPAKYNNRDAAVEIFNKNLDANPWFGLEQEYFICDKSSGLPLGYTPECIQGQYYCSVGAKNTFGRQIAEEHLDACLKAGIKISGINAEVAPGQWEFQIGICEGIEAGDHLWMARYLLERVAEKHDVIIDYHPKPIVGLNGSGCHTNVSTKLMRQPGSGLEEIYKAMNLLKDKHQEHIKVYGNFNYLRLTGHHETASINEFSYGIGNRGVSVRIGNDVVKAGCGYFEDRRPASNMDPYLVTSKIFETICL
jgi:glutamine synthetase